jgi:hypothetical protein
VRGTESLVDVYAYRWDAQNELVELGRFIDDPGPAGLPTCAGARWPTRSTPRRSSRATAARRRSTSPSGR